MVKRTRTCLPAGMQSGTALCLPGLLLLSVLAVTLSPSAYGNPQGGQVVAGQASITSSGTTLNIDQGTDKAIIDWRSFNIAPDELTAFHQPSASSIALNRINDTNPSQILGTLTANGHVILVNPNGVFFGPNSKVDVSGLIASTADIRNDDFMAGNYNFSQPGNPNAAIINQGTITAQDAGLVGFVAPFVENEGVIEAKLGKVELASGDSFTLDMAGDNLIEVAVSGDVAQQLASNTGKIAADGGTVMLTAAAGRQLVDDVVSNGGVIQANSIGGQNGHIVLYAEGSNAVPGNAAADKGQVQGSSTALNSGTLTASGYGSGETGGIIEVLGDHVGILSGASIDASGSSSGGTVRIGGDFHGEGTTPTAEATVMQTGASIKADAVSTGNGGDVALWSDNYTNFAGNISAHGGIASGDGGFVETSGKEILTMNGLVDASAPKGNAGTWLMDPADVTISTGADSGVTGNPDFIPDGSQAEAVLNVNDIDTALNNGTDVTVTTGGDALAGANNGQITVSNPINATTGTGGITGSLTLSAYSNIEVDGAITLGGAGVTGGNLTLDADNHDNGSGYIYIAAAIATNGGNITMGGGSGAITAGSGYAVGTAANSYGVTINDTVDAGGGDIIINGKGYAASTGGGNIGVGITSTVETSGNGAITISGTGGGTGSSPLDYGVFINNTTVSTVNGNLTINATGGSTTSGGDEGLYVYSGGIVETTGSGAISITATGGGTGAASSNYGVYLQGSGSVIETTGNGSLSVNATGGDGGGSGSNNYGLYVSSGTSITSSGGAMSITGTGGNSSGGSDVGVDVDSGGVVSAVNGNITITGTGGGAGTGGSNMGVYIVSNGSYVKTTGSGNIIITGTGGGSGDTDIGIDVNAAGSGVQALGSGNVTLVGTGGGSGVGNGDSGVVVLSSVTANGGNISITGTGGNTTGIRNFGVTIRSGNVSDTGNGSITLLGTGGGSGAGGTDYGVYVWDGGQITAANGSIRITGTGGSGTGGSNYGFYVSSDAGDTIKTTGSGNISITGRGGNGNYGVDIAAADGIQATGTGTVTAVATGSDILLDSGGSIFGNAPGTAVTLAAGKDFLNDAGSAALSVPNGRWLIYSTTPVSDRFDGLPSSFVLFGCTYGGTCPSIPGAGNGLLYSAVLPDSVSQIFSSGVSALQTYQPQFNPVMPVDYAFLTTMDPQLSADLASPFQFDAGEQEFLRKVPSEQ